MSVKDKPHFEVAADEFAEWLERQGPDLWWNVDGDPILTGLLSVPCPVDELVTGIRRVNRPLWIIGDTCSSLATTHGETNASAVLDNMARRLEDDSVVGTTKPPWAGDRFLVLAWKDTDNEWLLVEDQESTALARAESQKQAGT